MSTPRYPQYAPIKDWCELSGEGRSSAYQALGRGDLRAIKLGARTLIDVEHGLVWLSSLPAAVITTGRRRRPSYAITAAASSDPPLEIASGPNRRPKSPTTRPPPLGTR